MNDVIDAENKVIFPFFRDEKTLYQQINRINEYKSLTLAVFKN